MTDTETVSLGVYESAVKGRADFRRALVDEREKTNRLLRVIANFANPQYWLDEVGNLQWIGKRHAVEFAQSILDQEGKPTLGSDRWPILADGIGLIIADSAEPKPENIPYLAVKIAEAIQTGNY